MAICIDSIIIKIGIIQLLLFWISRIGPTQVALSNLLQSYSSYYIFQAIQPKEWKMAEKQQKLAIGPLVLKSGTPFSIYNSLSQRIYEQVSRINKRFTTELNFDNGRFNRHLHAIDDVMQWLDKYEVPMLISLNCAHNSLPTLRCITMFYLPRLEIMDLYDCQIQSIQMLTQCFFPNLQSLLLYNNHIVNIKSLRKCYFPFLSELIIDSNNISDIYPLYEIISVHVQRLEINNNRLIDLRPIVRVNYPSLSQLRMENMEVGKFMEEGEDQDGRQKLCKRKFINL